MDRNGSNRSIDPNWIISSIPENVSSQESITQSALRNLGRAGMRTVESVYGLPGDVTQGLLNVANPLIEKGLGLNSPLPIESPIPGSERIRELLQSTPQQLSSESKQQFQKQIEKISKPEGGKEEFLDEFIKDFVPLSLTGTSITRAGVLSGLGNFASWGAKNVGIGETGQNVSKVGTMLLASLPFSGPRAITHMKNLYSDAKAAIPEGSSISVKSIQPRIAKVKKELALGHLTEDKKFVKKWLDSIESKVKKGKMSLADAYEFKKNLNDDLYSAGKAVSGDKSKLLPFISEFNNALTKSPYPEFVKAYTTADNINSGIKNASFLRKFANKWITKESAVHPVTSAILKGTVLPTATTVGTAFAGKGLINFIEPFLKSSKIRELYTKIAKSALLNKAPTFLKDVSAFDKEIRKQTTKIDPNWLVSETPD